jgi:hypothetical protein
MGPNTGKLCSARSICLAVGLGTFPLSLPSRRPLPRVCALSACCPDSSPVLFKLPQGAATSPPAMNSNNPRVPRASLPPLTPSSLGIPDSRRSTPQPNSYQLTSPRTPTDPRTPPSIVTRLGTESPRSALDSPATTTAGDDGDEYQWTDDQIATVIRVCTPQLAFTRKRGSTYLSAPLCRPSRTAMLVDLRAIHRPLILPNLFHRVSLPGGLALSRRQQTGPTRFILSARNSRKCLPSLQIPSRMNVPLMPRRLPRPSWTSEPGVRRGQSPCASEESQRRQKIGLQSQYSVPFACYHPIIYFTPRLSARFQDKLESTLSPKFHPYQRPGAPPSTRSFKHNGCGLRPSPNISSSTGYGTPIQLARKSGKTPIPFRSVTPHPTSLGLEAGYDDPPVLPGPLETSTRKYPHPNFTQFRSPVRPVLDLQETPVGPPTSGPNGPSPLPDLSHNLNLSASLMGSPCPRAFIGNPLLGSVNASIENLKLATPKPSRAIQRSQSFTARPGDGLKRAPSYGGGASKVADLFIPPSCAAKAPATPQVAEHTEDPDAAVTPRGATRRKCTMTTRAPSAWDTRKKADKRPRTLSGSDTERWRSLVPATSPSMMSTSTPKAGTSRGGVLAKRARKDDTHTQTTANAGDNVITPRLTRSTKRLNDTLVFSTPSGSSSRSPASPGSPMVTSPLRGKTPTGLATKRRSTPHPRAPSLLASDPAIITKEQLQDENQDTSMITIEQPERRSSSPVVTRNLRRVGPAQFPPKVKRTRNQNGRDAL